jgi:transcription antitermination factor NusG
LKRGGYKNFALKIVILNLNKKKKKKKKNIAREKLIKNYVFKKHSFANNGSTN